MAYMRPEEVLSPKRHVGGVVEVIHDPGERGMSVARILWDEKAVIATRWNGTSEQPLGNPVSRGHATWFVIGEYAAAGVEDAARQAAESSPNSLAAGYRAMILDTEDEREAREWSEAMLPDAALSDPTLSEPTISDGTILEEMRSDASSKG